METRLEFKGTGGELFGKLIGGALLTAITFGIYGAWFQVSLNKYVYSVTKIRGSSKGDLQLEFTGTGGELFKIAFVGVLLSAITFGIYLPWMMANLIRWYEDHSKARAADGTQFGLKSDIQGGELFVTFLVGYLLTAITLGIYAPWFLCKLQKLFAEKTQILEQGRPVGKIAFTAEGGQLFGTFLVGMLLTMITFGIYSSWFQVKLMKFMSMHTEVSVGGRVYRGDFTGTGGDLFVLNLVGGLLTMITFGIYMFWYLAKSFEFQFNNTVYRASGRSAQEIAGHIAMPSHA